MHKYSSPALNFQPSTLPSAEKSDHALFMKCVGPRYYRMQGATTSALRRLQQLGTKRNAANGFQSGSRRGRLFSSVGAVLKAARDVSGCLISIDGQSCRCPLSRRLHLCRRSARPIRRLFR
jgi:hypothetical protein